MFIFSTNFLIKKLMVNCSSLRVLFVRHTSEQFSQALAI